MEPHIQHSQLVRLASALLGPVGKLSACFSGPAPRRPRQSRRTMGELNIRSWPSPKGRLPGSYPGLRLVGADFKGAKEEPAVAGDSASEKTQNAAIFEVAF